MQNKTFSAKLDQLRPMLTWIVTVAEKYLISKSLHQVELCSEEVIVNIIHHSKSEKIELSFQKNDKEIHISFRDNGIEFNPLKQQSLINKEASLEERSIGGLGIPIIRSFMDKIKYQRINHCNHLTISKKRNY